MTDGYDIVAIIPAKSYSKRLPEKNIKLFKGFPLFTWSIFYARTEGILPIVVTDSHFISHIAEGFGALTFPESKKEWEDYKVILKVIDTYNIKKFAVLQPISPLREQGRLKEMLDMLSDGCQSCYTTPSLDTFIDGDSKDYKLPPDGNIYCCTTEYFKEHDASFIGEDSKAVSNYLPYSMRIVTTSDFDAVENQALVDPKLTPHPFKSIVVVQNKRIIKRDYSAFIDSCDLVIRSGTCDNYDTDRTGKRCDIHFAVDMIASGLSIMHRDDRHLDIANNAAICFQWQRDDKRRRVYKYNFDYRHVYKSPWKDCYRGHFMTSAQALWHLHYAFPDSMLYNLGTHSRVVHMDGGRACISRCHSQSNEEAWLDHMVEQGKIVDILEEECTEEFGKFSAKPKDNKPLPELTMLKTPKWEFPFYVYPDKKRICAGNYFYIRWVPLLEWEPKKRLVVSGKAKKKVTYIYNPNTDKYIMVDDDNTSEKSETATESLDSQAPAENGSSAANNEVLADDKSGNEPDSSSTSSSGEVVKTDVEEEKLTIEQMLEKPRDKVLVFSPVINKAWSGLVTINFTKKTCKAYKWNGDVLEGRLVDYADGKWFKVDWDVPWDGECHPGTCAYVKFRGQWVRTKKPLSK